MDPILIQYILIAVAVLGACYSVFRMFQKNFSSKKFDSKKGSCDKDCGCS